PAQEPQQPVEEPAPAVEEPAPAAEEPAAEEPAAEEPEPAAEEPDPPAEDPDSPPVVYQVPWIALAEPADGASGIALKPTIRLTFSQSMDAASTEAAFSINPAVPGQFAWDDE